MVRKNVQKVQVETLQLQGSMIEEEDHAFRRENKAYV